MSDEKNLNINNQDEETLAETPITPEEPVQEVNETLNVETDSQEEKQPREEVKAFEDPVVETKPVQEKISIAPDNRTEINNQPELAPDLETSQRASLAGYKDPLAEQATKPAFNPTNPANPYAVPAEIKGWSWGAFMHNIIWGIGNKTYLPLLCLVPIFNIIWVFVCGAKGHEWAWRDGGYEYSDIETFKRVQGTWDRAGFVQFIFSIVMIVLYILFIIFIAAVSGDPATSF